MQETLKTFVPLLIAICSLAGLYFEHSGKNKAEDERDILIQQQNEIIKRYEKESERSIAIITFLDSVARAK